MKKKNKFGIFLIFLLPLIVLAGCQTKKVEPVEAAEIYLNAYMYHKDSSKMEEAFNLKAKDLATDSEKKFVADFKSSLGTNQISTEKLKELYQKYQISLNNNTSYQTRLLNEDQQQPIIELTIIGLNEPDEAWLDATITKKLTDNPNLITAEMDEAAIKKVTEAIEVELLFDSVKESTPKEKAVKINMELEENPDNKATWQVKDEAQFLDSLNTAFGL